ncbi:hypothetical protein ACFQAV_05295 [Companilactobacillus huachuanensis]|uniref:Uncharacterized protein n=1 Tax=Companilactobacillus huachuanensis TaxID=2559914 RepID=A0ABW1RNQ4_9LACO|nr:hypothetical protein [Companilactobacillus huachuanensis]
MERKDSTGRSAIQDILKEDDSNIKRQHGTVDYLDYRIQIYHELKRYFENEAIINDSNISEIENNKVIKEMISYGVLEYIGRGILVDLAWSPNDFLLRQLVLKQGIYSGSTALYLWGLSDEYPYKSFMTFKRGYRLPSTMQEWTKGIIVKQVSNDVLNMFVEKMDVSGTQQKINIYSKERALIDVLREPVGTDVINTAYKRYLKDSKIGVNKLMLAAKKLGALEKVRSRLEIMI